jgi:hypothetical protein
MPKPAAKERIRQFLLANVGNVVTSIQVRDAAGIGVSEWARRVRELRDDEHWPILTHNDSSDLKPGQYLLKEAPPEQSARCAAYPPARLIPTPDGRFAYTSAISKTRASAGKTS